MASNTLKSLDPQVRDFLCTTTTLIKNYTSNPASIAGGHLQPRIIKSEKVEQVTQIAIDSISHNATLAEIKSRCASVFGLLILPSFFLSALSLTKEKMVKSRPVALALGVAGVLFMTIWLAYRNYPARLAEKAVDALRREKEDEAIDLIAQGADLSTRDEENNRILGDYLLEIAFYSGEYVKAFIYLSLISNNNREILKYVFRVTKDLAIAKITLELGLNLEEVFNVVEDNRVDIAKAKIAFALGAPADLLLRFAKDQATAKFAIEAGAKTTNCEVMYGLFGFACDSSKKDLMDYLFHDLEAVSLDCGIEDYRKWDADLALLKEDKLPEAEQKRYLPIQLEYTPFECYLDWKKSEQKPFNREHLAECLVYFKIKPDEASYLARFNNGDDLFEELNKRKIRVRKATCQNMIMDFSRMS